MVSEKSTGPESDALGLDLVLFSLGLYGPWAGHLNSELQCTVKVIVIAHEIGEKPRRDIVQESSMYTVYVYSGTVAVGTRMLLPCDTGKGPNSFFSALGWESSEGNIGSH